MLEKVLPKSERLIFNVLRTKELVLDFLAEYGISYKNDTKEYSGYVAIDCDYDHNNESQGSFFKEKLCDYYKDVQMEDYLENLCSLYHM